jgi:hypothetical protein
MRRTLFRLQPVIAAMAMAFSTATPEAALGQSGTIRCYDLSLGDWQGDVTASPDSLLFAPPPRILLDTVLVRRGVHSAAFLLREAPGSLPSVHRFSYWQLARDSVDLVWSTGFAGLSARLHLGGDTLLGVARTFSDLSAAGQTDAPIVAAPIDCSEAPRFDVREQRQVPSGVRLLSGDSVLLGQRVQDLAAVEYQLDRGAARLGAPLARPFSAAREVQLLQDEDGRIEIIRFQLPAGNEWERVLRAVTGEYGSPTRQSSQRVGDLDFETIDWSNRSTIFSMHRSRTPGESWHTSVVLSSHRFRL